MARRNGPKNFIAVLPGGIIEIQRDSDKSANSKSWSVLPHRLERFYQKNAPLFQFKSREKFVKNGRFYETGLTKKETTTAIFVDEYSNMIEVQTHNTDLKKRLSAFVAKHPQCCRQTDDDEQDGLTFAIEKGRLSFRLTAPYSEERRRNASNYVKMNGIASQRDCPACRRAIIILRRRKEE